MMPPSNGEILNPDQVTFKVTPVFFNIGINECATLSETLGYSKEQTRSNFDNFGRLKQYYARYKKISTQTTSSTFAATNSAEESKINYAEPTVISREIHNFEQDVSSMLSNLEDSLKQNTSKNVKVLHLAEDICRAMEGLRFTSCKSAKDRTGMAITLEQSR